MATTIPAIVTPGTRSGCTPPAIKTIAPNKRARLPIIKKKPATMATLLVIHYPSTSILSFSACQPTMFVSIWRKDATAEIARKMVM